MIILGIHGGHDASVAVIKDGKIISFVMRERFSRIKHSSGLDKKIIQIALSDAKIGIDDIDACAITSTQNKEILSLDKDYLDFSFSNNTMDIRCSLIEDEKRGKADPIKNIHYHIRDKLYDSDKPTSFPGCYYFPEWRKINYSSLGNIGFIGEYIQIPEWDELITAKLSDIGKYKLNRILDWERIRFGFHYPITLRLDNYNIPGFMINHHLAHAASAYYCFSYKEGVILSHDGGIDQGLAFNSGFLLRAEGNKIYPLVPHNLILGYIYSNIGARLNLGIMGQAGKLMGLSSYGNPRFVSSKFIGNMQDLKNHGYQHPAEDWFEHCLFEANQAGYDTYIPKSIALLHKNKFCSDLASSTQVLFEKTLLQTIRTFRELLNENDINTDNIFFTGGVALNCPANTKIFNSKIFKNVSIAPWCNDSGLSLGAAQYLYYNLMDNNFNPITSGVSAYYGRKEDKNRIKAVLDRFKNLVEYQEITNGIDLACHDLINNKIIAWFEGGSEMGPRALGHRSILASAKLKDNIVRINRIKGREKWRPFGAMVLQSKAKDYFFGCPNESPHMLFTGEVKKNSIPAVTHIDHSCRIQTVVGDDGLFYQLLKQYYKKTGVPVLINTSFNQAGEPIVETPTHAVKTFISMKLDSLFFVDKDRFIHVKNRRI